MAQNFPGPMECEFAYTVDGLTHRLRQSFVAFDPSSVFPGMDVTDLFAATRSGLQSANDVSFDFGLLLNDIAPFFSSADAAGSLVDVYRYTTNTYDRQWITSFDPGWVGTSSGTTGIATQTTMTFRSSNGGVMKLVLLETVGTTNAQIEPGSYDATITAAAQNFTGANSVWVARDDGYAVSNIRLSPGQNEATWRKRFR